MKGGSKMQLALQIIQLIAMLLPVVTQVMQVVEQEFGPDTGVQKKAVVTEVVKGAIQESGAGTGVPPEVIDRVLSRVIDAQAGALKQAGKLG